MSVGIYTAGGTQNAPIWISISFGITYDKRFTGHFMLLSTSSIEFRVSPLHPSLKPIYTFGSRQFPCGSPNDEISQMVKPLDFIFVILEASFL